MKRNSSLYHIALTALVLFFIFEVIDGCSKTPEEQVFHVSCDGNDSWSGTLSEPNSAGTDGPFASLEKARDAVRQRKQSTTTINGGITVVLHGGVYRIGKTLHLSEEDSGSQDTPVVWRSATDEKAVLIGGVCLNDFKPVTDVIIQKRLSETARDLVLQTDLKTYGIKDYGDIDPQNNNRMELFFKHEFMRIARYPNDGWLTVAGVPRMGEKLINLRSMHDQNRKTGEHYGRFNYDGDRPDKWAESDDIWIHGYWVYDWSDSFHRIAKLDKKKKEIYPDEPYHYYGYLKGQRYYFLNILEELDEPGEWYLDSKTELLYFLPPLPIDDGDVVLSILQEPMIVLDNVSNITIQGLTFEGSRTTAIESKDGMNVTIAGCTFRNLGKVAVSVDGGANNGVRSCDIYNVGAGGISVNGGNRKTLEPAGNYAINNHIHHFGVIEKTYKPAISLYGVGNTASHNLMHHAPHSAILHGGNDNIIEYNETHHVLLETNDAGAFYTGRNPSHQGNIIRYNYFHDIGREFGHGSNSVYIDDGSCGFLVFGNIFFKGGVPGRANMGAMFIHGGRYNTIENNMFIECELAYNVTPWDNDRWKKMWTTDPYRARLNDEVNVFEPPYSEKYPWLPNVLDDTRQNTLARNVVYKCGAFTDRGEPVLIDNWVTDDDPGFVDEANGNFALRENAPIYEHIPGFKPIPFDKIGLYIDEYRSMLP